MAKYYILYSGRYTGAGVFQTEVEADNKEKAREYFNCFYQAEIQRLRKSKFSDSEITKLRNELRHA